MNTHIDTLAEWWNAAEETVDINVGDLVIEDRRSLEGGFDIWPARTTVMPLATPDRRVLSRAPKLVPAWHDAWAVLAECVHDAPGQGRGVFISDRKGGWVDETGGVFPATDLTDVTPLIEAKVTDEAVDRVIAAFNPTSFTLGHDAARLMVAAALNIDPA